MRAHQGQDHRNGQEERLGTRGHRDVLTTVMAEAGDDSSAEDRSHPERRQRCERRRNGETLGSRDRESQEHHVAGHIGDEHVAQHQVAERVDEPGEHRHCDQERRQRSKTIGPPGRQRLADLGEERVHVRDLLLVGAGSCSAVLLRRDRPDQACCGATVNGLLSTPGRSRRSGLDVTRSKRRPAPLTRASAPRGSPRLLARTSGGAWAEWTLGARATRFTRPTEHLGSAA